MTLRKKKLPLRHKPTTEPAGVKIGNMVLGPIPDEFDLGDTVDHPNRPELILVPALADGLDVYLPPVNLDRCPPETYYAVDRETRTVQSMVSVDADGVRLAWDIDKGGRYFLRVRRPLIAPRHVEVIYDQARVIKEEGKAAWSPSHKDWMGSLSGHVKGDEPYQDKRTPGFIQKSARAKTAPGTWPSKTPGGRKPLPKVAPEPAKRRLPRSNKVTDDGILSDKGVDQRKLNTAASDMADKYADKFPKKTLPRKTLKRK